MRIALVSPLMEAVPPRAYGGVERVVATLADELVWAGHDVTIFATADSVTNARLAPCRDRPILRDPRRSSAAADTLRMLAQVREHAHLFDIVHFHTEFLQFPLFEHCAAKTVTTCHSRLDIVGHREFFECWRQFPLISISEAQRAPLPRANWAATIPHGIPLDIHRAPGGPRGDAAGPYLAFLGRINPDKGVEQAIEIARRSGMRLKIAARINSFDEPYWRSQIEPLVDGTTVEYVGEVSDQEKSEFLGRAEAMLFPIQWPEPFGLVMIEAMACGCPVLAFDNGAVPEVIDSGVSGVIVRDVDEAVARLDEAMALDRAAIRRQFDARFSAQKMAADHLRLYASLVGEPVHHRLLSRPAAAARHLIDLGRRANFPLAADRTATDARVKPVE